MSDSIKVSPKHGLNPTIPQCFWCGKDKSEIALLGKMDKEDSPAPLNPHTLFILLAVPSQNEVLVNQLGAFLQ